jgi:hypothetical protein
VLSRPLALSIGIPFLDRGIQRCARDTRFVSMPRPHGYRFALAWLTVAVGGLWLVGCGTTRSSDTARTATEQLLISDAIDRAVQTVDFNTLRGQTVFLDDQRLAEVVDRNYLVSTLRQHLLASGCLLRDKREDADFIVEARAGVVGTDRNDLLFGVPSMNVPQIPLMQPIPAAIPEIPIAKRRDQRAFAKIAVFAYHRETGTPVWQSGLANRESYANDVWILGAGPFQRGTIYRGTEFAGTSLDDELRPGHPARKPKKLISLSREKSFNSPDALTHPPARLPTPDQEVLPAAHSEPTPKVASQPAPIVAPSDAKPIETPTTRQLPQPQFNSP